MIKKISQILTNLKSKSSENEAKENFSKKKVIDYADAKKMVGEVVIPNSMKEISGNLFDGNKNITSVIIPGTVKRIGVRAFADCENLKTVVLNEGIEKIESNVFTGCMKLRCVTYPDSVKQYQGWTFYRTNLKEPVMNVSKTILIFCPKSVSKKEWTVPDTVKIISWQAFIENKNLEHLNLPEGLEIIESKAFIECGLREITIPHSVRKIEDEAFWHCRKLEKVTILNPDTEVGVEAFAGCDKLKEINYGNLTDSDKIFHLKGQTFLVQHIEGSANLNHASSSEFKKLTALCAKGDAAAMNNLANWFEEWSKKSKASAFYIRAANYWRYRAYRNGNAQATEWFKKFFSEHPNEHLDSILPENNNQDAHFYYYSIPGKLMNDLGYSFFDPEREYEIKHLEGEEIVVVSTFESYEGPDEDGFGAETYYYWWFLDENMQQISDIPRIIATLEETRHEYFKNTRERAINTLKNKK